MEPERLKIAPTNAKARRLQQLSGLFLIERNEVLGQAQHHLFAGDPRQTGTVRVQPHQLGCAELVQQFITGHQPGNALIIIQRLLPVKTP